jgi:hypothetical protein
MTYLSSAAPTSPTPRAKLARMAIVASDWVGLSCVAR